MLRQGAVAAQLVEHGAANADVRVSLELVAAVLIEVGRRLDQAERAGRLQVFHIDAGREMAYQLADDVPHHRQVGQDQFVPPLVGSGRVASLRR